MSFTVNRFQGDTYPIEITVRRGSGPYDLTGCDVVLSVARDAKSAALATMSATTIVGSKAVFNITSGFYNLEPGDYVGQVQVIDADTFVWTPTQFVWKVKYSI